MGKQVEFDDDDVCTCCGEEGLNPSTLKTCRECGEVEVCGDCLDDNGLCVDCQEGDDDVDDSEFLDDDDYDDEEG